MSERNELGYIKGANQREGVRNIHDKSREYITTKTGEQSRGDKSEGETVQSKSTEGI